MEQKWLMRKTNSLSRLKAVLADTFAARNPALAHILRTLLQYQHKIMHNFRSTLFTLDALEKANGQVTEAFEKSAPTSAVKNI